ncbi:MAG: hypothetical protein AAF526_02045 [Pseudomonadota bacterium]
MITDLYNYMTSIPSDLAAAWTLVGVGIFGALNVLHSLLSRWP